MLHHSCSSAVAIASGLRSSPQPSATLSAVRQSRPQALARFSPRQPCLPSVKQEHFHRPVQCSAASGNADPGEPSPVPSVSSLDLVGEDAAAFTPENQSTRSWVLFFGILTFVLGLLYVVWIQPGTGYAEEYIQALSAAADGNSSVTILLILFVFALWHSGLAAVRPQGEALIGARAYRVIFAAGSLPLAVCAIVYFINHRYDGIPLWNLRGIYGVHELVWILNFISFGFLYPSTFNILEVAAVDKPQVHMWETGIMRISRHPQAVGQAIWCLAHLLWIGNSFMAVTSGGLMAHHLFGVWHGDRRLSAKYGEAFEAVKARTSNFPFQAIWEGRQVLPPDYYKEFLRVPYLTVTLVTLGAYFAHPLMQQASYYLKW